MTTGRTPRLPPPVASSTIEHAAALQTAIQTAAERAAPALRAFPALRASAQLQVHRRHGTILTIDGEPVDEENLWHACVRRELGHIEYPLTSAPVKARVRFSL